MINLNVSKSSIFVFHEIYNAKWFESVIQFLKKRYTFIALEEILYFVENGKVPNGVCHLTFDDGHISFYDNVIPILQSHHIPATLFVSPKIVKNVGDLYWFQTIDYLNKEELKKRILDNNYIKYSLKDKDISIGALLKSMPIKEILRLLDDFQDKNKPTLSKSINIHQSQLGEISNCSLFTIGAHTMNHPILANETLEKSTYEIRESINQLGKKLGKKIDAFAYPNGKPGLDFSEREKHILEQNGIKIAFTTKLDHLSNYEDNFSIPRIDLSYNSLPEIMIKILLAKKWALFKKLFKKTEEQERIFLKKQNIFGSPD